MRAVLYLRISDDRAGTGLGVARQDRDCRERCAREGWEVADVLVDNDRSAYSGKARPGYQRLLEGLKVGEWDVLVAWHPDRLHRSPRELEQFIDVVEAAQVNVVTVMAGAVDLTTATGRMTARVVGAVARHESEQKSERTKRKHQELAEQGKPSGNGRTYGFAADLVTHVPAEVAVVRQAARDLLDGVPLLAVVTRLNEQGVPTASGGEWRSFTLRRILTSHRTAGLRSRGDKTYPAKWQPVLDEVTWRRVRALLLDPTRRLNQSPRLYLLTGGLAVCGLCDAALVARPKAGGRRCYVCASGTGFHGCGRIRLLADMFERDVLNRALARLADAAFPTVDTEPEVMRLLAEIEVHEASVSELAADYYVHRTVSKEQFQAASGALGRTLDSLRAEVGRLHRVRPVVGDNVGGLLRGDDLPRQRAVLEAIVEKVTVGTAVKGHNFYRPERVLVTWRH